MLRSYRVNERLVTFPYDGETTQRLDKFLVECLPEFSRSRLQNLIKNEYVKVDGRVASKAGQTLEQGALVEVHIPPPVPSTLVPESVPLEIIFENPEVLVVNKPAGMVVHPSAGHATGTLVHAALAHAPEMNGVGGVRRPGVVHRLDKNTSGLILLAKNDSAHNWLQSQFKKRQVKKEYLALVDGTPPTQKGRVEAAIGRDPSHRKRMAILPNHKGRQAISEYRTVERFSQHTLVRVFPLTGRTHQIRLHMKFLGCPIVGDTVYGKHRPSIPIKRHFLHAHRLTLILPGESAPTTFEAPLPGELVEILESLTRLRIKKE
jgi:23S rRNA pseudouridine1911/1915/1917 synthase